MSRMNLFPKTLARGRERYVHPTDDGLLVATEVAARQPSGERSRIVPEGLRQVG